MSQSPERKLHRFAFSIIFVLHDGSFSSEASPARLPITSTATPFDFGRWTLEHFGLSPTWCAICISGVQESVLASIRHLRVTFRRPDIHSQNLYIPGQTSTRAELGSQRPRIRPCRTLQFIDLNFRDNAPPRAWFGSEVRAEIEWTLWNARFRERQTIASCRKFSLTARD